MRYTYIIVKNSEAQGPLWVREIARRPKLVKLPDNDSIELSETLLRLNWSTDDEFERLELKNVSCDAGRSTAVWVTTTTHVVLAEFTECPTSMAAGSIPLK